MSTSEIGELGLEYIAFVMPVVFSWEYKTAEEMRRSV